MKGGKRVNGSEEIGRFLQSVGFLIFMGAAAWQDIRRRSISLNTFFWAAVFGLLLRLGLSGRTGGGEALIKLAVSLGTAALPGAVLLGTHVLFGKSVGQGDGLFFLVSGVFLGAWKNFLLLWGSLLLCFPVSVCLLLMGRGREYRLPFLPFAVPVGIGVIFL